MPSLFPEKTKIADYTMPLFQQLIAGKDRETQALAARLSSIIQAIQQEKMSQRETEAKLRTGFVKSEAAKILPESIPAAITRGVFPSGQEIETKSEEIRTDELRKSMAQNIAPEQAAYAVDMIRTGGKTVTQEQAMIDGAYSLAREAGLKVSSKPKTIGAAKALTVRAGLVSEDYFDKASGLIDEINNFVATDDYRLYNSLKMDQAKKDRLKKIIATIRASANYKNTEEYAAAMMNITRQLAQERIVNSSLNRALAELESIRKQKWGKDAIDSLLRKQLHPEEMEQLDEKERRVFEVIDKLNKELDITADALNADIGEAPSIPAPKIKSKQRNKGGTSKSTTVRGLWRR